MKNIKNDKNKNKNNNDNDDDNNIINLYQKINYDPEDKDSEFDPVVQKNIHHLYNCLTQEQQEEWLQKTTGLGWSKQYIDVALSFWHKQGKYCNKDEELVNEYLETLTDLERSNFKDVCDVFSPDKPYVHIKDSCGFLAWLENKQKK